MTMRKLLRKRNAFRQLLQNLETRPLCADGQPLSGGWLSQPRPGLARAASGASGRPCPGERR
jgi:hypothetical protein